jgi:hypothetical protein
VRECSASGSCKGSKKRAKNALPARLDVASCRVIGEHMQGCLGIVSMQRTEREHDATCRVVSAGATRGHRPVLAPI